MSKTVQNSSNLLEEEKAKHKKTDQCKLFLEQQCQYHRPYTCFNWHFPNQKRRKPVKRPDGTFNYNPDVYCDKYDENTGSCPNGEENAGDTEKRYHPRYFKTGNCIYETTENGTCVKNGPHCAFAHGSGDIRQPIYDVREIQDSLSKFSINLPACLEKERVLSEDPKWKDMFHVLACYKTELCKKPPRMCRQGYSCPFYHNGKDKRRPPEKYRYKSTPCPAVRPADEWLDSSLCENSDDCQFCHTRTEQQFHPEIYNSSKCNDVINSGYCPRGSFCAFAHLDNEMNVGRDFMQAIQMKANTFNNLNSFHWIQNNNSLEFPPARNLQDYELTSSFDFMQNKRSLEHNQVNNNNNTTEGEDILSFRNTTNNQPNRPNVLGKSINQFESNLISSHSPILMKNHNFTSAASISNSSSNNMISMASRSSNCINYNNNNTSGFSDKLLSPMSPITTPSPGGGGGGLNKHTPKVNFKAPGSGVRNYPANMKFCDESFRQQKRALKNLDLNPMTINVDLTQQTQSDSSSGSLSYSSNSPWSNSLAYGQNKYHAKGSLMNLINNCLVSNNLETIKTNLVDVYISLFKSGQITNTCQDSIFPQGCSFDDPFNSNADSLKGCDDLLKNKNLHKINLEFSNNIYEKFKDCQGLKELTHRLEQKSNECERLKKERDLAIYKLRQSMILIRHLLNENENFRLTSNDIHGNISMKKPVQDELKNIDILELLSPDSFNESFNEPVENKTMSSLWSEDELSPRQMAYILNSPWNHQVDSSIQQMKESDVTSLKLVGDVKGSGESIYCLDSENREKSESEKLLEQRYILSGRPKSSLIHNADSTPDFNPNLDIANLLNAKDY